MAFKKMGDRHPETQATNLIDLHSDLDDDPMFAHLRTEGNRVVPGFGSLAPAVMVVGSAPGATEITHGAPFCGTSGVVLRDLMDSAGLTASQPEPNAWMTYTLKYRPPGRKPTVGEVLHSQPYLRREWMILGRPRVMVAVGAPAWSALGPPFGGLMAWAGQPILLRDNNTYVYPMLPPEYGMINEDARPTLERHWMQFGRWLREEGVL